MKWEVSTAKNGEATLILNGVQLYSRYRPREDAWKWVDTEFDDTKSSYLLIGLGLGYHAERLVALAGDKPVNVYYFDEQEYELAPIEQAVATIDQLDLEDCQILIPNVWIKALGDHPVLPYLEDIKINQQTYKKFAAKMERNFYSNIEFNHDHFYFPTFTKKSACLVASGPSLNETIHWLEKIEDRVEVFVVGSALQMVLENGINPVGVIISDPKDNIIGQLKDVRYSGYLYYLSTANEQAVKAHTGPSILLLQQGYPLAEELALEKNLPLLETGGSVATLGVSLLEVLQFERIILFGQDLGFTETQTHAKLSTSGRITTMDFNTKKVLANDGTEIFTVPNLQTYRRWIEKKVERMSINVFTTSAKGAKIKGVSYLNEEDLLKLIAITYENNK